MQCNRELIAKMSPYCTKGSRGEMLMLIAAYQVPFDRAKALVKGLDQCTHRFLMGLGSGAVVYDGHKTREDYTAERRAIRESVYALMGEGLTFEEIAQRTGLCDQTLGIYATDYARETGIERGEIACVAQAREEKRAKWRTADALRRARPRLNLRRRRYDLNIPAYAVARELGISVKSYRSIEYGARKVSPGELATLSQLLDADGAWLAERTAMDVPKGRNFMGYDEHTAFLNAVKAKSAEGRIGWTRGLIWRRWTPLKRCGRRRGSLQRTPRFIIGLRGFSESVGIPTAW